MAILDLGENRSLITRRRLLIGGGVGAGLLIVSGLWPRKFAPNLTAAAGEHIFNGYVKIGEDGHVTVVVPQIETGQGAYTLIPQVLADELGADWRTIAVEPAPLNPLYANQMARAEWSEGLSTRLLGDAARWLEKMRTAEIIFQVTDETSTLSAYERQLREAGAAARTLLCKAAAGRWDADWRACDTENGFVVLGDQKLRFGDLVAEAVDYDVPSELPMRTTRANRLTGTSVPRLDLPSKVDGSANFAADIRLPNMVYAAIRMGPLGDTRLKKIDRSGTKTRRDVIRLVTKEKWVAAVAATWWSANQALDAIKPVFETQGPFPDSTLLRAKLERALETESVAHFETGDVGAAFESGRLLRADYFVDLAPHAVVEPMAATAVIRDGKLELWLSTQVPGLARQAAADAIGYDVGDVIVHPVIVGGSSGRKYEIEIAAQVAVIASQIELPVQLVWSRSEDMMQDRCRPPAAARMVAQLAAGSQIEAWRARIAVSPMALEAKARLFDGASAHEATDSTSGETITAAVDGAFPPYAIPNVSIRHHPVHTGIPSGKWRSDANSYTAFFTESFIDELANQSGVEAFSFRMTMLGANPRLALCLSKVAVLGGWQGGGTGTQQGIACHMMRGSFIAILAEARIDDNQRVAVDKIFAVADVGRVAHPDIARQQVEGALIWGMAAATGNRVEVNRGVQMPRHLGGLGLPVLADCPEITLEILPSREPSGDFGEIGVPAIAPAIANALFAGSGRRFRSLPLLPVSL